MVSRQRERQKRLAAEGRCAACGRPRERLAVRCDACQRKYLERLSARRRARHEAGRCSSCGGPREPGRKTCGCCRRASASVRALYTARGLCRRCGGRPHAEGRRSCAECLARERELSRRRKETARGQG